MKAVAIRSYGGPQVLQSIELPRPVPAAGEVLIRVAASGVNPADGKWRMGMFAQIVPLSFPYVPGYDVAGTVESGGALAAGSRVFAMLDNHKGGAYAQFAVTTERSVARTPEGLDDATAAALPTSALTGVQLIEEHIAPRSGERVLITGATGAVGRFALHTAKASGAYVIAAVRAAQRQEVLALGADEALVLGEVPSGEFALDHLADTVGGSAVAVLCRQVRPGGRIRTVATTPIPPDGLPSAPEFIAVHTDSRQLAAIARAVADGHVRVPIAHVLPLADASKAHRLLEAGGVGGKIILTPW
jgi:NADPH2:quinone reductase